MGTRGGWNKVTAAEAATIGRQPATAPQAKRSKFGAVKTTIDGITFDSKREAARYAELKLMQQAGRIRSLRLQPRYALCVLKVMQADCRDVNAGTIANQRIPIAHYVADFEYEESYLGHVWNLVVEDVKGMKTAIYQLKKRLFEMQYGIPIREIR